MPLFAHPAVAWLLPAVVLPVLFHLFFRLRRQVLDFPSLLFFQRIDPLLSAKRKIHDWVILFLRCLFIALLLGALLRPLLGLSRAGGSVARLVLLDNSGSMAGPARNGMTKWELAKEATLRLISSLRPGDSVAVQLAVPDPTVSLPDDFGPASAALRDAVQKLVVSDGAASVPKAMRRALAQLDDAKAARRELIVVTDLQRDNWSRGDFAPGPTASHVVIRRIATAPPAAGEAAFQSLELPVRSLPAGRITPLQIVLQNSGGMTARMRLNSSDDSGRNQTRALEIAPGTAGAGTLAFSFTTAGFHWAECWIEGDAAPAAVRADLGFWITDVRQVLFSGTPDDFGALPYAVSPGGNADLTGLDSEFIDPAQVAAKLPAHPLAVVTTWNHVDPALEDYVSQGGTLLIVPGGSSGLAAMPPEWIHATVGNMRTAAEAEPILLLGDGDPIWHDLRDESGRPELGTLRAFQYQPVHAVGKDWTPLLAAGQGSTLLARRPLGRGRIIASGLAFTPRQSSLPLKAGFVVLVQNALFDGAAEAMPVRQIHAGDEVALPAGDVSIKSLAGNPLAWTGEGRSFVGFPRAGIYEITQPDHVEWMAVSADPLEAHLDFLPLGPIPLLHGLPHDVAALAQEDDLARGEITPATSSSFYPWLLLAALLVLLAETWLANERSSEVGRRLFTFLASGKNFGSRSHPVHATNAPAPAKVNA